MLSNRDYARAINELMAIGLRSNQRAKRSLRAALADACVIAPVPPDCINTFIQRGTMTFEQRLYQQVCQVLPNTTTRTFSRDCGMSENYYCSIQSQRLRISTAALLHLAEVMEHRQTLGQTIQPIEAALHMLADEIASRSNSIKCSSFTVQRLIARAIATTAYQRDCAVNLPAISMGWL
jgi:hypothetical protein